jgi:hypothetical protein
MVFFEFAFILVLLILAGSLITAAGRPLYELYLEKFKFKYKGIESEAEARLNDRIRSLEQEVSQLRTQLTTVQESSEFALKLIQQEEANKPPNK